MSQEKTLYALCNEKWKIDSRNKHWPWCILAKEMRTRHTFAGFKQKCLAYHTAKRTHLKCLWVISQRALRRDTSWVINIFLHLTFMLYMMFSWVFTRFFRSITIIWPRNFNKRTNRSHIESPHQEEPTKTTSLHSVNLWTTSYINKCATKNTKTSTLVN
jgi:hypothetical protein